MLVAPADAKQTDAGGSSSSSSSSTARKRKLSEANGEDAAPRFLAPAEQVSTLLALVFAHTALD